MRNQDRLTFRKVAEPKVRAMTILRAFLRDESGATAIEYGLIAGLIAVVIIGALRTTGAHINSKFQTIGNALT